MPKNKSNHTVIEITRTHLKILHAKSLDSGHIIDRQFISAVDGKDFEEVKSLLREYIRANKVKEDSITLIVPRQNVILKRMRLPSCDPLEIQKMIGLQLVDRLPYAEEDIRHGHHLIESGESGYTDALAFIMLNEVGDRYYHLFKDLGMNVFRCAISSLALVEWVNYHSQMGLLNTEKPIVVISIDAANTEICFCYKEKLLFSRSILIGLKHLEDHGAKELISQINASLLVYQEEKMGPSIRFVCMVTPAQIGASVENELKEGIELPVHNLTSCGHIPSGEGLKLSGLEAEHGVSLAAPLGQIIASKEYAVNLAPQSVHEAKRAKAQKSQQRKMMAGMLMAAALLIAFFSAEYMTKKIKLTDLTGKVESLENKYNQASRDLQLMEFIEKEYAKRIYFPDIFYELALITPENVSFRNLSLSGDGSFAIQGYAEEGASVNDLQSKILSSGKFHEVNLEYAKKMKVRNLDVTNFKISTELHKRKGDR